MYPDSWIYRGFKSCNFDLWWKQNGGHDSDLRKIDGFKSIIYAQIALIWKFQNAICTATSTFDKCHYICCLRAEFAAKHGKAPLSLTTRWQILAHVSCPIYRALTYIAVPLLGPPPTAIYREYTVPCLIPWHLIIVNFRHKLPDYCCPWEH